MLCYVMVEVRELWFAGGGEWLILVHPVVKLEGLVSS